VKLFNKEVAGYISIMKHILNDQIIEGNFF